MAVINHRIFVCLCAALISPHLLATSWQANGFISQAYMHTENSRFIVGDDNDSFALTEAMLATSWRSDSPLRLAGALNYRQWGELTDSRVNFDYLFVEYNWHLWQGQQGIRLGRVKGEYGLYNSTRDVPFTRPSIILPQSIYPDLYRDAQLRIDGGDWFGEYLLASGVINWHVIAGFPAFGDDLADNIFGNHSSGEFEPEPYYSATVNYQSSAWYVGISYYQADIVFNSTSYMLDGNLDIDSWVASLQYRQDWWQLTSEINLFANLTEGINPNNTQGYQRNSLGFYVEGRVFLPKDWQLYLRFDNYDLDSNNRNAEAVSAVQGEPKYFSYSKDWTLGGQWLFEPSWMLALEYHQLDGAAWVPSFVNRDPLTQAKEWSIVAAQLSYRFQW
ncbi:hypothetical protein FJQ87_17535 [Shewanella sp. SNU WT4]|uniref:TonB-dependent receptor n=1 Tax=Shewanella sp. SNU WT4 TaxID=2590015 RepID=UPI00112EDBB2|nr:TonB-dependent receptor [Shewanella sp. SNU WT4]QDF68237.1 hypothetical protein FJQ87_17535 [Shewanella sp. SNU WT4]